MIPVCEPLLAGRVKEYVQECLDTNWISSNGRFVGEFEEKFAEYCGCKYGISTTSGTTALHLALTTLGIGKGDEVIVPTFTMVACAFAVIYTGAKPVFVDCELDTYNIAVDKIEEKITSRTRAIMPVHIYGHPCDMKLIWKLASKYGLYIVEDAAESHGAKYKGKRAGSLGDIGCFSFYANKIITTGEGGMLVTNNNRLASRARLLKDLAHSPDRRFLHTDIGFNYRMTNIQAAVGLAQLERIDYYIEKRRSHALLYNNLLAGLDIQLPTEKPWAKNVYWMYAILVNHRDEMISQLVDKGIGTRTFFVPMHQQPMFQDNLEYPVADDISKRGLYLPSGSGLSNDQIEYICKCIKEVLI